MTKATTLARVERKFRPWITQNLPPKMVVSIYSEARINFIDQLKVEFPKETYDPPEKISRNLWGIKFRTPLMNAAGMFKNGEAYPMVARQGAGAYLGGTGTWNSRVGNEGKGIKLPFAPYPESHAASNWLGLPNDGDKINADRAADMERVNDCPVGWSVMGSPDLQGEEKLEFLVEGMKLYAQAGVDFIEINESCPNTEQGKLQDDDLVKRLRFVKEYFLDKRGRNLPVVVKLSNDTEVKQVPEILDLLFELGYDGVNFGNTSINYSLRREHIDPREGRLYDFFTQTFGGGASGKPLKESSLELASRAVEYTTAGPPSQEFHVVRTGGIETQTDIDESDKAGVMLNQWFTGYFANLAQHGHNVYRDLFETDS